jgi:uncharacterized membrane protein YqjE
MQEFLAPPSPKKARPGLAAALAGAGQNLLGLVFSRIELAAFELAEARTRLLKITVVSALALIAVWFAVAYWSMLIVMFNWDALGWKIVALTAAVFSAIAFALLWYVRALLRGGKLAMRETADELRKDRDALLSASSRS